MTVKVGNTKEGEGTCDPGDPDRVVMGGEGDRDLLWLEPFDAALNPGIRVRQIHRAATKIRIEWHRNGLEGAIQSRWNIYPGGGDDIKNEPCNRKEGENTTRTQENHHQW